MSETKTCLNVKIDKSVKETAAKLLASMGLDHDTAIDMYYRQIIIERTIPFRPKSSLTLDEQLTEAIRRNSGTPVRIECDDKGELSVDKEKYPEIHEWLVNG